MTADEPGRVPVGELRDLVEEWLEYRPDGTTISEGYRRGRWMSGYELEAVIERYE